MKFLYAILCVVLNVATFSSAVAQQHFLAQSNVQNLKIVREGAVMHVTFEVDATQLKTGTNGSVTLEPYFYTENDTCRLPILTLSGRSAELYNLRNALVAENETVLRSRNKCYTYNQSVPFETWMYRSQFTVDQVYCRCTDRERMNHMIHSSSQLSGFQPTLLWVKPACEPVKMREQSGKAQVDFRQNITTLDTSYRSNAPQIAKIVETIKLIENDENITIRSIEIHGYASPEGTWKNNNHLAAQRTRSVAQWVMELGRLSESLIATDHTAENWEGLRYAVESSSLKYRNEILQIIDNNMCPDDKEREIKSRYPQEYNLLLHDIYPELRYVTYTVEYIVRGFDLDQARALVESHPEQLSLEEMYRVAQEYEPGSEAYNRLFQIAVKCFPQDPTSNLNAANVALSKGDAKTASRYLENAGNSPEAEYAKGVCAFMTGDYEQALLLWTKIVPRGIDQAAENIRRMESIF